MNDTRLKCPWCSAALGNVERTERLHALVYRERRCLGEGNHRVITTTMESPEDVIDQNSPMLALAFTHS